MNGFGGRPRTHDPVLGRRTNLSIAVPLTLKQKIEKSAKDRGWSVSAEAALRLEVTFWIEEHGRGGER